VRTDIIALLAFCGFFFFAGLQVIGLVGADEPRYAADAAREMLLRHDWVTPYSSGILGSKSSAAVRA